MRLDTDDISMSGKTIACIRCDQIGGSSGIWWVAEEFTDGTTKPEGMYTMQEDARHLADELAARFGVPVRLTSA